VSTNPRLIGPVDSEIRPTSEKLAPLKNEQNEEEITKALYIARTCVWCADLPEPLYKTVYVDSATVGVRLADSAVVEPIRQFYVQYRPTGELATSTVPIHSSQCADSFSI